MTREYHRSRPEGRHHRTKLRVLLVPKLRIGAAVPSSRILGHMLRISASEGFRHMRRVLAEEGIRTETRGRGKSKRIYVVAMPKRRAAA
jgi:hypothetical protein